MTTISLCNVYSGKPNRSLTISCSTKTNKDLKLKKHSRNMQATSVQERIGKLSKQCNADFTTEVCDNFWIYLGNIDNVLHKQDIMINKSIYDSLSEEDSRWDVI